MGVFVVAQTAVARREQGRWRTCLEAAKCHVIQKAVMEERHGLVHAQSASDLQGHFGLLA